MDKRTRQVLQLISSASDSLQFFQIYRRLFMTPAEIAEALESLRSEDLVEVTGSSVKVTDKGYLKALGLSAKDLDRTENNRQSWKEVPAEFLAPPLTINAPYAPSIDKFLKISKKD